MFEIVVVLLELLFGLVMLILGACLWIVYYAFVSLFWIMATICEIVGDLWEGLCEGTSGLSCVFREASPKTRGTILGLLLLVLVIGGAVATELWLSAYR